MPTVVCPLCGNRRARRGCPAVGQQICPVCCGTKRLVEINCPADCVWLASAREHPPAARLRQQERDRALLMPLMLDFSERQVQLFFLLANFIARYEPPELQPLFDEDVEQGAGALASTYETASRGVIYEHRASSLPGDRFANALKPVLAEMGRGLGSGFERDAAGVLRRLAALAHDVRKGDAANQRAFIDMLRRLVAEFPAAGDSAEKDPGEEPPRPPSLIVP